MVLIIYSQINFDFGAKENEIAMGSKTKMIESKIICEERIEGM